MDTMETDRLIDDYLRRLEDAAAHMQRARRAELVAEIRSHIDTALRHEQGPGAIGSSTFSPTGRVARPYLS